MTESKTPMALGEDAYRLIADNTPAPIAVIRLGDDRILWVNRTFAGVVGIERDDLIGRCIVDFAGDEQAWKALRARLAERGELSGVEFDGRMPDGSTISLLLAARVVELSGERVMIATAADVSAQQAAAERLRQSEGRLQAIATLAPFPVGVTRLADGALVYVNAAFAEFMQSSAGELLGRPAPDFYADPADRTEMLARLRENGSLRDYQIRARLPDGEERLTLVSLEIITFDDEPAILAAVADITDWQAAEAALRDERLRQAGMLDIAGDAIISVDCDDRIVLFNRSAEEMFGYTVEAALGQSLDMLIPDASRAAHRDHVAAFASGDESARRMGLRSDVIGRRESGELFPAGVSISKLEIAGQMVFTAIVHDLTAARAAEEALEKSRAQLLHSQKMEAVGRLAGGVAHDFNNLLTAIYLNCAAIRSKAAPDFKWLSQVEEIQKASTRAAKLTQQLLALGRKQTLERTVVDISDVVPDVQDILRRLIPESIELRSISSRTPLAIEVDAGQLEQVLLNLVINAADSIAGTGTITVTAGARVLEAPLSTAHGVIEPGSYATLSVADTGHGMDRETLSHVFEPFYTTKGPGIGTGLGLSTAHGIVEQSGGAIEVQSTAGEGTTFRIWLPVFEGGSQPGQSDRQSRAARGGTETILLVEDDPALRRLTGQVLEELGYAALSAANAQDALEICRSLANPPQLVLTDVVMPGMSGQALARQLRDTMPTAKLLLMTGYAADHLPGDELSGETVEVLRKPFSPRQLAAKVRAVLDSAKSPTE